MMIHFTQTRTRCFELTFGVGARGAQTVAAAAGAAARRPLPRRPQSTASGFFVER